jgi:two-component system chemotaxis response regulator CheY
MKVLLVDDDRTVRFLLKVILVRSLGATVVEAENGLDALERLSGDRFDLVLLDVNMPMIDGPEVLRAIRASTDYASVPVVMISADRQDVLVRRCIALGISDYISKPFSTDQITARLSRLRPSKPAAQPASRVNRPGRGDAILIAEGNADVRQTLVNALQERFTIVQADSGARALTLCLERRPRAVLVGTGLGLLGPAQFVEHARKLGLADTLLVGLVPKTAESAAKSGFDSTIARSSDPAAFLEELDRLLSGSSHPEDHLEASLEQALITATEQFCGMVLGTETNVVKDAPRAGEDERFCARVTVTGTDAALAIDLRIRCNSASAAILFNQTVGKDPDAATDDDKVAALGEAANIITERLKNSLSERGMSATSTPAALSSVHDATLPKSKRAYCFSSPTTGLSLHVEFSLTTQSKPAAAEDLALTSASASAR